LSLQIETESQGDSVQANDAIESTTDTVTSDVIARPDDVPEKFWNSETSEINTKALLESYVHLEKKISKPEPETEPETKTETKPETKPESVNFDDAIQSATNEFQADGKLSEATLKSLADMGISQNLVDGYIKGVEADNQSKLNEVYKISGSEDSWNEIMTWAASNLDEAKTKELNKGLASDDERVNAAVELKSLFDKAAHTPQVVIGGQPVTNSDNGTFKSQAELVAAMSDPRYKHDTDYQQKVHARLAKM